MHEVLGQLIHWGPCRVPRQLCAYLGPQSELCLYLLCQRSRVESQGAPLPAGFQTLYSFYRDPG